MKFRTIAIAVATCAFVAGCKGLDKKAEKSGEWKLVWADEFNKDGAPDPDKWIYEKGFIRNAELQYYTDRPKNVRVEGGNLVIEAHREKYPNANYEKGSQDWTKNREFAEYTSAALETYGKAEWTYGRFEVRLKVPAGRGTWPAAWMLGSNIYKGVGWPLCGEIDIMEYVGYEPHKFFTTVHTEAYNHAKKTQRGAATDMPNAAEDFHVFVAEWDKEQIEFFIDGKSVQVFKNEHKGVEEWPFDKPQFLLLNFAVGGGWGGVKGVDPSIYPAKYYVDYVRVYQKG